ncbi:MAG: hypothetical protein J6Y39_07840 [Bacteroidaceae bacterium]|nr:hypothetical protein [Bacteroidaceae bacterium]
MNSDILLGAIAGGIAEAYNGGVLNHICEEVVNRLPQEFVDTMREFYKKFVAKD